MNKNLLKKLTKDFVVEVYGDEEIDITKYSTLVGLENCLSFNEAYNKYLDNNSFNDDGWNDIYKDLNDYIEKGFFKDLGIEDREELEFLLKEELLSFVKDAYSYEEFIRELKLPEYEYFIRVSYTHENFKDFFKDLLSMDKAEVFIKYSKSYLANLMGIEKFEEMVRGYENEFKSEVQHDLAIAVDFIKDCKISLDDTETHIEIGFRGTLYDYLRLKEEPFRYLIRNADDYFSKHKKYLIGLGIVDNGVETNVGELVLEGVEGINLNDDLENMSISILDDEDVVDMPILGKVYLSEK